MARLELCRPHAFSVPAAALSEGGGPAKEEKEGSRPLSQAAVLSTEAVAAEAVKEHVADFFVLKQQRTGFSRLHRVGGCPMSSRFVEGGPEITPLRSPSGLVADAYCRRCWPEAARLPEELGARVAELSRQRLARQAGESVSARASSASSGSSSSREEGSYNDSSAAET